MRKIKRMKRRMKKRIKRSIRKIVTVMDCRILLAVAALAIVTILIGVVSVKEVSASEHGDRRKVITSVEIMQGDTLWDIASEYYSDEFDNMNDYIKEIKKVNNMPTDKIVAGNYIIIPYYK